MSYEHWLSVRYLLRQRRERYVAIIGLIGYLFEEAGT